MKRAKKEFIGKVFAPTGTKDYSTYITKIRQSGAEACYLALGGDDYNAFLSQSRQYGLPDKVTLLTETVELNSIRAVGEASLGLVGSSRYCFTLDRPQNAQFVAVWKKEHGGALPDTYEGEMWQAMQVIHAGIEKAKSTDLVPLRTALETIELEKIKGPISMRACDHQIMQQGYMVKVVKKEGFETPVPDIIATFPGERTTPACRKN